MTRSVWMERVFQILSTSGPQPVATLVAEAGGLIPPGKAFREREFVRNWHRRHYGAAPTAAEPTDEAIWSGRRRLITRGLWSSSKDGLLELYKKDGVLWARFIREAKPSSESLARAMPVLRELEKDPEFRSARAKKSVATRRERGYRHPPPTPKQSAAITAVLNALTFEERSARSKKAWASMTPEMRKARSQKQWETMRARQHDHDPGT